MRRLMYTSLPHGRHASSGVLVPAILVALFWLFTYAVLSYRTQLLVGDAFLLFTVRRTVATTVGAIIYGAILWRIMAPGSRWLERPAAAIATILPASLLVLTVRLAIEAVYSDPLPLGENVRWVIVWASYYGLWVSSALALLPRMRARNSDVAEAFLRAPAIIAADTAPNSPEAWAWLIDALAEEAAQRPAAERALLIDRLRARAGYELADSLDGTTLGHNERIALVERLAERLSRR